MRYIQNVVLLAVAISFAFFTASIGHAQILGQIEANIHHRFIVGNATLPPGHYVFRMPSGSDNELMTASIADGDAAAEFLVHASIDSHTPRHTELVFDRFDDKEFLTHIYEKGDKNGETVAEPSRIEARLEKQGKTPFEHTEEQK